MKKVLCMILVMSLMVFLPINASAETNYNSKLDSVAKNTIQIQSNISDNSETITYKNIEDFVTEVRKLSLEISDLELAKFILQYTGQDFTGLSEETILETLIFKEITVDKQYIKVTENGEINYLTKEEMNKAVEIEKTFPKPLATWKSDNGYMQIETTCSLRNTKGNFKYYTLSAKATWLKIPVCFFKDVLTIAHTGKYDDAYTGEEGYLEEVLVCCGSKYTYKQKAPSTAMPIDYCNIVYAYSRFQLISSNGYECIKPITNHTKYVDSIVSYLKYGIVFEANHVENVQGAYCHKQVSVGNISVSVSSSGFGVSFSLVGSKKDYIAKAVTIYT